jgi:hypothetical protein
MRTTLTLGGLILGASLAASMLGGCRAGSKIDAERTYPIEKSQTAAVDVQVIRNETQITMVNTTAQPLPAGTIWINGQFSHAFDGLTPGSRTTMSLKEFRNEYGEAFRAGGFFATQRSSDLVMAQIETDTHMIGLVVVNGRADR